METIHDFLDSIYDEYSIVTFRGGRVIRGKVKAMTADCLAGIRRRLTAFGWRHSFEVVDGVDYLTCTVIDQPVDERRLLHAALFLAAVFTTLVAGGEMADGYLGFSRFYYEVSGIVHGLGLAGQSIYLHVRGISPAYPVGYGLQQAFIRVIEIFGIMSRGIPFSFAIITILGCHEMGHYVAARLRGMNATLPFFIPIPAGIGTLGAVIRIKSPLVHRRVVLDVGAAGPLAGAVVAIIFLIIGIRLSAVAPMTNNMLALGDSFLTQALAWLFHAPVPPGQCIISHPFMFAGWIGLLVTAINLLPIGQLDGGHVAYALFGPFQRRLAAATFGMLITLGVIGLLSGFDVLDGPVGTWPWLLFAVFVRSFMKAAHPPVVDDTIKLNAGRKAIAIICFALLVLCFVPAPM